jgi:1,4-dihydroxy-2-naphthoate octaprenyltransferase
MQAAAIQAAPEDVRAFIQEYFDAWKGTDEKGKTAVQGNFVRPSVHCFKSPCHGDQIFSVG